MPTYQYLCNDCGEPLEVVQKFTDDALTVCPQCEGSLRKVFNAVGIVFKGSGFYRNDSRDSAKKKAAAGANGSASSESGSSESNGSSSPSSDSSSSSGSDSSGSGSSGSASKSDSSSKSGSSSKESKPAATPAAN